jgi:hypothetical protein
VSGGVDAGFGVVLGALRREGTEGRERVSIRKKMIWIKKWWVNG